MLFANHGRPHLAVAEELLDDWGSVATYSCSEMSPLMSPSASSMALRSTRAWWSLMFRPLSASIQERSIIGHGFDVFVGRGPRERLDFDGALRFVEDDHAHDDQEHKQ